MNASELRPPGGFEDRLEAELVKVVTARAVRDAHGQRPRRRAVVLGGVLAVGSAAVAAVSFAGHGTGAGQVHIRTAAFSVDTSADGSVRLTWDKSQYIKYSKDFAGLQQALREAGFPVVIKEGVFCKGPHDNGQLDPSGDGPGVGQVMRGEDRPDGTVVFTFTPSAMPTGDELFIGYLSPSQLAITHGRPGSVERLVPAGVPLTCTTKLPAAGGPNT